MPPNSARIRRRGPSAARVSRERATAPARHAAAAGEPNVSDELLAVSSLSRALAGDASLADVRRAQLDDGSSGPALRVDGIFLPDEQHDRLRRYAAGATRRLRGLRASPGTASPDGSRSTGGRRSTRNPHSISA